MDGREMLYVIKYQVIWYYGSFFGYTLTLINLWIIGTHACFRKVHWGAAEVKGFGVSLLWDMHVNSGN